MSHQSFGPAKSSVIAEETDPANSKIGRGEAIAMNHETERIAKMFGQAPSADSLKCSFDREQEDRLSRIEVEIRREGDGSLSIVAKDSLYHQSDDLRVDIRREPELAFTARVAIGADGNLVRAMVENHKMGEIHDQGASYTEAYRAVGRCHLDEVERYATGRQRGGNAELAFRRAGELVKNVDVDL